MTEQEKAELAAKEAAETEAEAKAKEDAAQDDEPEVTEAKAKEAEESKQYEAELKKEREAREKAEKALAEQSFKQREKKRTEPKEETETEDEEDKPISRKEFQTALAKEREDARKEVLQSEADRLASSLSTSESEKQLILEKWKNRSFPAYLSLSEQLEECYVIANKKRIMGENSELKRALRGKDGVKTDASGTHRDSLPGSQPKMSAPDSAVMTETGFKWSGTNRRWEKKLPNGQTLVQDPKTKRNILV